MSMVEHHRDTLQIYTRVLFLMKYPMNVEIMGLMCDASNGRCRHKIHQRYIIFTSGTSTSSAILEQIAIVN